MAVRLGIGFPGVVLSALAMWDFLELVARFIEARERDWGGV
jgi:hypothetical protein